MTDVEYDILDELYFVQSFVFLLKELGMSEHSLKKNLGTMIEKGWIKCFRQDNTEVFGEALAFDQNYREYLYLATKRGLMAHNAGE